ncbi:unnamed protein product, partial [Mesorhabditis belari]
NYYHDVVRECSKRGGIVAKIQNAFENAFFYALISDDFDNQPPYIGVEKKPNGNWTYADGTPLTYQHWASEGPCPSNWLYFDQTKSCYYLQNFIYPDSQHWKYWNFTEAEALCQGMHGHLVSFHSKTEYDFVMDLIGTNVNTTDNLGFLSIDGQHVCWWKDVWTGLVGTGVINNGYWTDGTPVDYSPPHITNPEDRNQTNNWIMCNDPTCDPSPGWYTLPAVAKYSRFMCKMPGKSLIV